MKLTEAEIEKGRTAKGGFTRKQLAQWGVSWPPPKGWKKALMNGSVQNRTGSRRRDNSQEAREARSKHWQMDQEFRRIIE